jgi:hypothetical protein
MEKLPLPFADLLTSLQNLDQQDKVNLTTNEGVEKTTIPGFLNMFLPMLAFPQKLDQQGKINTNYSYQS